MNILNSLSKIRWSGSNFEVRGNGELILKKNAFAKTNVGKLFGRYHLKLIGKKRTGNGGLDVIICSSSGEILSCNRISITKRTNTEIGFSFNIEKEHDGCFLYFERARNCFGTVEIAKIAVLFIKGELESVSSGKNNVILKNNIDKNITKKVAYFKNLSKRKIVFIIPYSMYGGAEVYLRNIINNLDENIFNIYVIYMKKNLLSSFIGKKNVNNFVAQTYGHLKSNLIANNYDYIVYYNSYSIYREIKNLALNNIIDGFIYEIYHSDFIWNDSLSRHKKRDGIGDIISISDNLANDISGISHRHVVPVGIDIELFSKKNYDLNIFSSLNMGGRRAIGSVSRLSDEKNIEYIINLAKVMQDFFFIIIGDGPKKSDLRFLIKKFNLQNIAVLGYIKNVYDYYNIFDAFILPSKCNEGTPISILESMACEVPVFTTMYGNIKNFVIDGHNGFEITLDIDSDCKKIIQNIDNNNVTINGRKYVEDNHNIIDTSSKFSDILLSKNYYIKPKKEEGSTVIKGYYA